MIDFIILAGCFAFFYLPYLRDVNGLRTTPMMLEEGKEVFLPMWLMSVPALAAFGAVQAIALVVTTAFKLFV